MSTVLQLSTLITIIVVYQSSVFITDEEEESSAGTHRDSKDYVPVTEREFTSVSSLVRGRVKLADVNKVSIVLTTYMCHNRI